MPLSYQPYFDDPRLRMTFVGRMFARAIVWVCYLMLVVATFLFLFSDLTRVWWLGIGLLLFLLDRFVHRGEGDIPIGELALATPLLVLTRGGSSGESASAKAVAAERVNVMKTMRPAVANVIEHAFDRSVLTRRDFFLEVVERMFEIPTVREALVRLDVKPEEFRQKLESLVAESVPPMPIPRTAWFAKAETLAIAAFREALASGQIFIEMDDVFSAVARIDDPLASRLFAVFSIEAGDLSRALVLSTAAHRRLPGILAGSRRLRITDSRIAS